MAIIFDSYCPSHFQSLPSVIDAHDHFSSLGGLGKVEQSLAAVAKKHASSTNFGVQLLHRHADLDPDEVLLTVGAASQPVKPSGLSDIARSKIQPIIWGIRPGSEGFSPLEYAVFDDDHVKVRELDPALAKDIAVVLIENGLDRTLGLAVVTPGQQGVLEFTHDRANIVVPIEFFTGAVNAVEVLWPLACVGKDVPITRKCMVYCSIFSPPPGRSHKDVKRKCVVYCNRWGPHNHDDDHRRTYPSRP